MRVFSGVCVLPLSAMPLALSFPVFPLPLFLSVCVCAVLMRAMGEHAQTAVLIHGSLVLCVAREDNELVTSFMDDEDAANPLNQTITMAPSSASKMSAVETEDRRLTYALGNLNLDSVNRRETFCVPPRGAGGWVDDDAGSQGSGETSTTM